MGNHQSIDGNTRAKSASQRLPNTQQILDYDEDVDPLRNFNLSPPSAAVIGAGVAGVHAAYELAKVGFHVTVFEEKDVVASGETQHSLPFVGVGLLEPSLARISLRSELVKGLFPASCPSIIARDHLFNSLFSSPLHRWILARTRGTAFNEEEIMFYTDNLSRLSHQTIAQLAARHPALQQHIRCSNVQVGALEKRTAAGEGKRKSGDSRELVAATTAHPRPIMVDPVGWTRTLANICEEKLNVRFAFGERLEGFHTYLKYNVETTRSIRVSKQDPENPSKRLVADKAYDVVVLTAGANTGALTTETSRLPIVGLSGVALTVQNAAGDLAKGLQHLFAGGTGDRGGDASTDASLVLLSGPCTLFGYKFQPKPQQLLTGPSSSASTLGTSDGKDERNCASPVGGVASPRGSSDGSSSPTPGQEATTAAAEALTERYTVSGLMSFDTTESSNSSRIEASSSKAAAVGQLARLEAFVRVMCDQELPLVEYYAAGASPGAAAPSEVTVTSYTRAFTPDGVPIIDHCGGAFNTFVCSGFGDQAMDFAPGSARVLCQLVKHQAEVLLLEDEANQRAIGIAAAVAAGQDEAATAAVTSVPLPASRIQDAEYDMQMLLNGRLPDTNTRVAANQHPATSTLGRWLTRITGGGGGGGKATGATPSVKDGTVQSDGESGTRVAAPLPQGRADLPVQEWRVSGLPRLPSAKDRESPDYRNDKGETLLHFTGNPYSTNRFRGLVKKTFRDINLHSPTTYLDAAENTLFAYADPLRQRLNRAATHFVRQDNVPVFLKTFVYNNMYYDGDDDERRLQEGRQGLESRQRVLAMREGRPGSGAELLEHSKQRQAEREQRAREASVSDLRPRPTAAAQQP